MTRLDYPTYAGEPATLAADAHRRRRRSWRMRTTATLREAEWFVRCRGETSVERLGTFLRVGSVVTIEGAGSLHSGNWLVWNVVHRIRAEQVRLSFTLVRNAVGPRRAAALPGGCSEGSDDGAPRPAAPTGPTGCSRSSSSTCARASTASIGASSPKRRRAEPRPDQGAGSRPCSATWRAAGACRACRTRATRWASRSCPRSVAASGSSSRAATCRIRFGSAATGAAASCRPTSRRRSR